LILGENNPAITGAVPYILFPFYKGMLNPSQEKSILPVEKADALISPVGTRWSGICQNLTLEIWHWFFFVSC
jgi:hypothetical protein